MKKEPKFNQHGLERILRKLESGDHNVRGAATKELVGAVVSLCGSKEKAALLLGVSLPTVYRWATGNFSPRDVAKVKAAATGFALGDQLKCLSNIWTPAQEPGIHSVDVFFERSLLALNAFAFKSLLEFGSGDSEQFLSRMSNLLRENKQLTIHCVFPSESRADETLSRFYELTATLDEEWGARIQRHTINDAQKMMTAGLGCTGHLVLEYLAEGRKQFDRLIDAFVETPVRLYDNGKPNPFRRRNIFIELPAEQAHALWSSWKTFMENNGVLPAQRSRLIA